jgi:hypothetical protein
MRSWRLGETRCGEPLADLLLGEVDAVQPSRARLGDWYALLNCGLRLPLLGGSLRTFLASHLGGVRTYARLGEGEEFGYGAWIEAVRAGRTVLTEGPLLRLTADGQGPGATLALPKAAVVKVRAEAHSLVPFDRVEIVAGGSVFATAAAAGSPTIATVEEDIAFAASGWLTARCWKEKGGAPRAVAHTSPVYVSVAGEPPRPDIGTVNTLVAHLDEMLRWVANEARCETEQERARLAGVFQAARDTLLARAAHPTA